MGAFKFIAVAIVASLALAGPASVHAQCRLCETPTTNLRSEGGAKDVALELETSIRFDRVIVAGMGDGSALLRPDGSVATQGAVEQVSSRAMVGSAVVYGEPGRPLRVELPSRIVLTSIGGGQIIFDDVVSDLPAVPRLDASGKLTFRIGGRLRVSGDAEGDYRGDLPIIVEYL